MFSIKFEIINIPLLVEASRCITQTANSQKISLLPICESTAATQTIISQSEHLGVACQGQERFPIQIKAQE